MLSEGDAQVEDSLLIVDDDRAFLQRLARAMEARGYAVATAESVREGLDHVERQPPAYAVVDMRLSDGNGLDVISALKRRRPEARGIVLTGYGNIATAVNAIKESQPSLRTNTSTFGPLLIAPHGQFITGRIGKMKPSPTGKLKDRFHDHRPLRLYSRQRRFDILTI